MEILIITALAIGLVIGYAIGKLSEHKRSNKRVNKAYDNAKVMMDEFVEEVEVMIQGHIKEHQNKGDAFVSTGDWEKQ